MLGNHQFDTEVQLRFAHPLTGEPVSSPVVFLNDEEYQKLHSRQAIRAQGEIQLLGFKQIIDASLPGSYYPNSARSINVSGSLPSSKPACAARSSDDAVFSGVYFTAQESGQFVSSPGPGRMPGPYVGTAYRECTWTLPANSGDQSHLLVLGNPRDTSLAPLYSEVVGNQIRLRIDVVGAHPVGTWNVWVNGGLISTGSMPTTTFTPVMADPILQSTATGEFSVSATTHREDTNYPQFNLHWDYSGRYTQRKLIFGQTFPDFDSGGVVPITNTIQWSDGSSVEAPRWVILGENDEVLAQGTSTSISAIWDPSGATEGSFTAAPSRIKMKALAYRKEEIIGHGSFNFQTRDVDYEITEDFDLPGELKIVNAEVTPDSPFQNPGDSVELTADIVAVGLGDLAAEDVEWWVDLIGPDGNPVGDPLAMGNGFEVTASWDGKVEGIAAEDPSSYSLRIRATACDGVSPQQAVGLRSQAEPTPMQGCPHVEVAKEITDKPELVFVDLDSLVFGTSEITSSKKLKRDELNRPRQILQDQKVLLRKIDPTTVPSATTGIEVSFNTSKSTQGNVISGASPLMMRLPYSGGERTEPFVFPRDFYPRFFQEHSDGNQVKRGFTIIDSSPDDFFHSALIQGFLSERNVLLGRSHIGADPTLLNTKAFPLSDKDDVIETSRHALASAGFESVELRADDPRVPKIAAFLLNIRFRMENQAPLLFYRGSISLPGNVMDLGQDELSASNAYDVLREWKQVRTVFLTGSGVLNLGNLANTPIGRGSVEAANTGRPWAYSMLGRGAERILGYNRAPLKDLAHSTAESRCHRSFLNLLDTRFYRNNSANVDETALAWVYGHINTAMAGSGNGEVGPERNLSAVAFTKTGYLFVHKHGLPLGSRRHRPTSSLLFVPIWLWQGLRHPNFVPFDHQTTVAELLASPSLPAVVNRENVYTTRGVRRIDEL